MKKILEVLSPLLSRRLIMAILALYMLRNSFWGIVTGLSGFTDAAHIAAYQALAIAYLSAIVGVVMWYIGNTTWKGVLTVASNLQTMLSSETREEKTTIIDEGAPGAPERRPWQAVEDEV